MDPQTIYTDHIKKQKELLKQIEKDLKGNVLFFAGDINRLTTFNLHKILRSIKKENKLFLILESPGGELDSAAKIINICKEYSQEFNVIVPFYAKSAASLIALSADNLFLGNAGEIGPIDPQVKHPALNMFFPALAIKDAIEVTESSKDPYVKMSLADKIDPYLMGAYQRTLKEAGQHLEKSNLIKSSKDKEKVIKELTQTYISHGYPICAKECSRIGIKTSKFKNDKIFEKVYTLFEEHVDFIINPIIGFQFCIISPTKDILKLELKIPKSLVEKQ